MKDRNGEHLYHKKEAFVKCPKCDDNDIEYAEEHWDFDSAYQQGLCSKCGAKWTDYYISVGSELEN